MIRRRYLGLAGMILACAGARGQAPTPVRRTAAPAVEIWVIDQLRLPIDTPTAVLQSLAPDHSLAAVVKRLTAAHIPFARVRLSVAPDRLPPKLREMIQQVPQGEPFVAPERNFIGVNVLVGRRLPADTVRFRPSGARPDSLQEA